MAPPQWTLPEILAKAKLAFQERVHPPVADRERQPTPMGASRRLSRLGRDATLLPCGAPPGTADSGLKQRSF
jgi:hypothetical protein